MGVGSGTSSSSVVDTSGNGLLKPLSSGLGGDLSVGVGGLGMGTLGASLGGSLGGSLGFSSSSNSLHDSLLGGESMQLPAVSVSASNVTGVSRLQVEPERVMDPQQQLQAIRERKLVVQQKQTQLQRTYEAEMRELLELEEDLGQQEQALEATCKSSTTTLLKAATTSRVAPAASPLTVGDPPSRSDSFGVGVGMGGNSSSAGRASAFGTSVVGSTDADLDFANLLSSVGVGGVGGVLGGGGDSTSSVITNVPTAVSADESPSSLHASNVTSRTFGSITQSLDFLSNNNEISDIANISDLLNLDFDGTDTGPGATGAGDKKSAQTSSGTCVQVKPTSKEKEKEKEKEEKNIKKKAVGATIKEMEKASAHEAKKQGESKIPTEMKTASVSASVSISAAPITMNPTPHTPPPQVKTFASAATRAPGQPAPPPLHIPSPVPAVVPTTTTNDSTSDPENDGFSTVIGSKAATSSKKKAAVVKEKVTAPTSQFCKYFTMKGGCARGDKCFFAHKKQ